MDFKKRIQSGEGDILIFSLGVRTFDISILSNGSKSKLPLEILTLEISISTLGL